MKKEVITPLLTLIAMLLVVGSRLKNNNGNLDLLGYLAIVVLMFSVVKIYRVYAKTK